MMDGGSPNTRPGEGAHGEWGYSSRISNAPLATPPLDWGHTPASVPRQRWQPAEPHEAPSKDEHAKQDGKDKDESAEDGKDKPDDAKPMPRWKKALYWVVGLAVLAALILAGVLYYLHARHYESTD